MKKLLILFCMIFLGIIAFGEKELRIGTNEWPPFVYTEKGNKKGIHYDIIKAVFEDMKIKVQINVYPWSKCMEMLKNKDLDAVFTLTKNSEREKFILFGKEAVDYSENVLFYRAGRKIYFFDKIEDLKDMKIGVTSGYYYGKEFAESRLFRKEESKSDEINLVKLDVGESDLFVCDKVVGMYLVDSLNMKYKIRYLSNPVSKIPMYIGFSKTKENEEMTRKFDETLIKLKKNGKITKIVNKYLDMYAKAY